MELTVKEYKYNHNKNKIGLRYFYLQLNGIQIGRVLFSKEEVQTEVKRLFTPNTPYTYAT